MSLAHNFIGASAAAAIAVLLASPAIAGECQAMLDEFNRSVDSGLEVPAQKSIDMIATSTECGRFQVPAQRRLPTRPA